MFTSSHNMVSKSSLLPTSNRSGSFYDALPQIEQDDEVMLFARVKLLVVGSTLTDINGPGSLACLLVCFTLEFNVMDEKACKVALKQIEGHMGLCVVATAGFQTLVTIAGSELVLVRKDQCSK
jgi:hypothetical protein